MEFFTCNEQQTLEVGLKFAKQLCCGDVICLDGDLGAGKTVFCKVVALGLGVDCTITSPTFVLCCEYAAQSCNLVHIDAYRLHKVDISETGIDEKLNDEDNIVLVEWGKFLNLQYDYFVSIQNVGGNNRKIEILPFAFTDT